MSTDTIVGSAGATVLVTLAAAQFPRPWTARS